MPRPRNSAFEWNYWLIGLISIFLLCAILPLFNPDPAERSLLTWNLEPGIGRQATLTSSPTGDRFDLNVIALDSLDPWRVRITRPIALAKGESLTIRFLARAELDHSIELIIREGQAPYNLIGERLQIPIGSRWTQIEHTVVSQHTLVDGRIEIQAGQSLGALEINGVQIDKGPLQSPNVDARAISGSLAAHRSTSNESE